MLGADCGLIDSTDAFVIDYIERVLKKPEFVNVFLTARHHLVSCCFDKKINNLEDMYYSSLSKNSFELNVLFNISQILFQFWNDYSSLYIESVQDRLGIVQKNLNLIHIDLQVSNELLATIRGSNKRQYYKNISDDQLIENIKSNVKIATIFRCSYFSIFNKAKRDCDFLKYTKGNTVVFDISKVSDGSQLRYMYKQPLKSPKKLVYKGPNNIAGLICNNNYNYNV